MNSTRSWQRSNRLRGLVTATMFLTRIPVPTLDDYSPQDSGRSLPWFPIVGLLLGGLLLCIAVLMSDHLAAGPLAAILLLVWVFTTGGLHLDGLGDSADGWLGGQGDRQRTLEIMKDPSSGSAAVMTVVCVLLAKYAALSVLLEQQAWAALVVAPMLGRCVSLLLFRTTAYVSPRGLAQDFIDYASPRALDGVLALCVVLTIMFLGWKSTLLTLLLALTMLWCLRWLMLKRLGGSTGDTAGASVEIIEMTVLLAACLH